MHVTKTNFSSLGAQAVSLNAIDAEVMKARLKFPGNNLLIAALMEEVGELAKALLQRASKEEIDKEAVQVCAVAVRIMEEGDRTFFNVTDAEAKK